MTQWEDACAQAELVRSGAARPAELVEAAIARIEAANETLGAVVSERFDRARAEAAGPLPEGPFRGVPLLLKDLNCPSAGDPQYLGTRVLRDAGYVADHDSAVTRRFRQAGFVIVGRTNTPEFGTTITTEPLAFPPARNPWNPAYSTGGSSGGSAAAVAAGLVPVAHASDGGGSIRVPASECGLVGLKPSRARVSAAPDAGEGWMGASTNGALTRTVRDAAAVLDALAGPEPGDPYAAIPLPGPLAGEVGADPGTLRIGFVDRPLRAGVPADEENAAAVVAAARLLESLGHKVDQAYPAALGEEEFTGHFANVVAVGTAAVMARCAELVGRPVPDDEFEPLNQVFGPMGRSLAAPDYLATINWMHAYTRRVVAWWGEGWDVLVTPVLNGTPPPLGWLTDPHAGSARVLELLQYTSQFNITGQPAISLPLHWSAAGLPVGIQFVAAPGREDVLIRLAAQLEAAVDWPARRPPSPAGQSSEQTSTT